jgi:hypothetical protein
MRKFKQVDRSERKIKRVEVLMSDRELQIVDAAAKEMRLNRSEYLRARGLKYPAIRSVPKPEYAVLMLNYRELRTQGNYLHQMTKAVNLAKINGQSIVIDEIQLQATAEANDRATQAILATFT